MLPRSLFVHNIQRLGEHPVSGGGFADIWRGLLPSPYTASTILMNVQRLGIYHEQVVALKVLRVFAVDGVLATLRKVSDRFLAHAFSKLCSRSSVKRPWFGVN
jgi:hypothetical protein